MAGSDLLKLLLRALVVLFGCMLVVEPALAQREASGAEVALLGMINRTRVHYGLRPLVADIALSRAARAHADRILRSNAGLEHQYPGEPDLVLRASRQGAHFSGIGENIARDAQTPEELHSAWMSTPIHRGNILSSRWNAIGIGVLESHGLLYAVEDFSDAGPGLTDAEIELAVSDALRKAGVASAESSMGARAACQSTRDPEGPALVVTWDGPNPTQLPPALLQRLAATPFQSAEVGACGGRPAQQGFTTTRVAVLLY